MRKHLCFMSGSSSHYLSELREAGSAGMRANLIPGIALWIFGISIVLCYYSVEPARPVFDRVGSLRSQAAAARVPALLRTVRALEARISELEERA